MGGVYEAIHNETRRHCALKVMLPALVKSKDLRARFKLECTVASNVDSEHVVQVFDAGVDGKSGLPYLVMELLKGEELFSMLERRGALPASEVVTYLYQAALALERTHAAGVIHRDLKPENLFVTYRDDGSPRLKILDFGIAKVVSQSQERITSGVMGTPLYMAPEQLGLDAEIGPRTDNYALGQLAFAMLTGFPYFELESGEEEGLYKFISRVSRGIPEPATVRAARFGKTLPPAFDAWFAKAAAQDPKDRFRRPLNLVALLAEALGVPAPAGLVADESERIRSQFPGHEGRGAETALRRDEQATLPPAAPAPSSASAAVRTGPVLGIAVIAIVAAVGAGVFFSRDGSATRASAPSSVAPSNVVSAEVAATFASAPETALPAPTAASSVAAMEGSSPPIASASVTTPEPAPTLTSASGQPRSSAITSSPPSNRRAPKPAGKPVTDPLDTR